MLSTIRAGALVAFALVSSACGEVYVRPPGDDAGDAAVPSPSRRLAFDDSAPLQLQPSERRELRVRVTDSNGAPVAANVRWSLIGDSSDATLLATQSAATRESDGTFVASVELEGSTSSAVFNVRASTEDGAEATRSVSVSDRGFGVIRAAVRYEGVRSPSHFELALFSDGQCDSIRAARPLRSMTVSATGSVEARFEGLAADLEFAVVAEGIGAAGERVSRGCIEGIRVVRDADRAITLRPDDLSLHAEGEYALRVQLGLDVVARASRALWIEQSYLPADPSRTILASIAYEVERTSGTASRASFESAVDTTLAAEVTADLRRRDAMPEQQITAWADSIASTMGGAVFTMQAEANSVERGTELSITGAQLTVDPRTPEDDSDDLSRVIDHAGMGAITSLAGDRAIVSIQGAALPVSQLAVLARDAHLARSGARSTAERMRSIVRCDLIASAVRANTARCDNACAEAACERSVDEWAERFDAALTTATSSLRTVNLSFVGVASAPAGSVTIQSIASSAVEGRFVEDPSRPVLGVGSLSRP